MVSELLEQWPHVADVIASTSCVVGAFACIYLMQAILHERTILVHVQRASLLTLGTVLLANAMSDVRIIDGRRETGVLVDVAVALFLLIAAVRSYFIARNEQRTQAEGPADWNRG